jgi:DNA invertase Pin-like site-specific DNA recombinase
MEQPKVIIYARFSTDVEQEEIDSIKEKMDGFLSMIGAKMMGQYWEIVQKGHSSDKIEEIMSECSKNRWGILTYNLKTLHEHQSGALSIVSEGADMGVPIFFIDPDSALKSIFSI